MIKRKLYLYFILIIIIAVFVSSIISSKITTDNYMMQAEQQLRKMIGLASLYLENTADDFNQSAVSISRTLSEYSEENKEIRVTVISEDGTVLGDSEADYMIMENHIYRDEIKQAVKETIGISVRKSSTTGIDYMYIALKKDNIILRLSYPLDNIALIKKSIYLYTLIGALIAVLIAALLALKLSSNVSLPISLLSEHSKEISKGNYAHTISYNHKKDELKTLIDSYNDMTSELNVAFNRLNSSNMQLDSILNSVNDGIIAIDNNKTILFINKKLHDYELFRTIRKGADISSIKSTKIMSMLENSISSQESYQEELVISSYVFNCFSTVIPFKEGNGAIITLQDVTEMKKAQNIRYEFVSNVTHELNTPLTSIQGFVETLKNGAISDTDAAGRFLDIIDIEAERLKILINDILTLSSIENADEPVQDEPTNIRYVSEQVLMLLRNQISEKNIEVINEISDNLTLPINADRAKQLFINLIDNAIKYNNEKGMITLFAEDISGYVRLHVKDNGIGIEKKHLKRLFERFYRVDKGRSRDMGGTGLGLSIVKHIALLYKGYVEVTSEVNQGSDFIVTLPKSYM